eukprot:1138199-Pelagomonas_calceolata.AAC.2
MQQQLAWHKQKDMPSPAAGAQPPLLAHWHGLTGDLLKSDPTQNCTPMSSHMCTIEEKLRQIFVLTNGAQKMGNMVKEKKRKKGKSTLAKRPRALRKGSLTSKLARISPKGPQT